MASFYSKFNNYLLTQTTHSLHTQGRGFFGKEPKAEITVPLVPVALVVKEGCTNPAGLTEPDDKLPPG